MLRHLFFTLLLVITGHYAFAQDTIYRTNHDKIVAKIQEVGPYEIKFKRYSAPDGPVYILKKTEIWKIVYSDGTVENYSSPAGNVLVAEPVRRWMVGMNAFDLVTGMITLQVEYAWSNRVSFKVPLSSGVNALFGRSPQSYNAPDYYYYNQDKVFSTGLDVNYAAVRTHYVDYFIGFSGEYGQVQSYDYIYSPYPNPYPYPTRTIRNYWYIGTGLKNGFAFKPSPQLTITVDCALGMDINDYYGYRPMGRFGVSAGWRFGKEVTR